MITDISKLPKRAGETTTQAIIRCYHEAFIVQTVGAAAGGISLEEFEGLKACGLVAPTIGYTDRPVLQQNDFLIAAMAASERVRAEPQKQREMQQWTLGEWTVELEAKPSVQLSIRRKVAPLPAGEPVSAPRGSAAEPVRGSVGTGTTSIVHNTLTSGEQLAFERVTRDTADFIRGLGNIITEDFDKAQLEVWREELPLHVPDPILRRERIAAIRAVLQEAVKNRWSAQKTASVMAKATDDYARNWRRVAETELQALNNDVAVIQAIHHFGKHVKIARIPETTACKSCKSLFCDEAGIPLLFTPTQLVSNGTNIGKKRADWKPTVYPLHPRCRCGVQAVPPGWKVGRYGDLTRDTATV